MQEAPIKSSLHRRHVYLALTVAYVLICLGVDRTFIYAVLAAGHYLLFRL